MNTIYPVPRIHTDKTFWRRIAWSRGIDLRIDACDCSDGMRMVSDGHGGVEWDICVRCTANYTGPYPVGEDRFDTVTF